MGDLVDWILVVLAGVCVVTGIIGAVLPVLPGPPIGYVGLLLLQLSGFAQFSTGFLVGWGVIALLVTLLDYYVPVWGTKRFGGSSAGVRGSTLGLIVGMIFFPPLGIIIGPFVGAVAGELLVNYRELGKALSSGIGSLVGFLLGTGLKLATGGMMAYYYVRALV